MGLIKSIITLFFDKHEELNQKQIFLTCLIHMGMSDGEMCEAEIKIFREILKKYNLSNEQNSWMKGYIKRRDSILKRKIDIQKSMHILSKDQKNCILLNIAKIANADGKIDYNEQEELKLMFILFKVDRDFLFNLNNEQAIFYLNTKF